MEPRSKFSLFFEKAINYFWTAFSIWAVVLTVSMFLKNMFVKELIRAIGIYVLVVFLILALIFAKDWDAPGWAGATPFRLRRLYIIGVIVYPIMATGWLIYTLLH